MIKSVLFWTLLGGAVLVLPLSCKCWGEECNLTVRQSIEIAHRDPNTGNLELANAHTYTVTVAGVPWTAQLGSVTNEFQQLNGPSEIGFENTGNYEGIVTVDGVEKCRFLMALTSAPCCDDYPQGGVVTITNGSAVISGDTNPAFVSAVKIIIN